MAYDVHYGGLPAMIWAFIWWHLIDNKPKVAQWLTKDEKEAMEHVAGYILHNDYSEREFQLNRGGQWVKGKSFGSFAPLGPWLVTKDEVPEYII